MPADDLSRRRYWTDYLDRLGALFEKLMAYPIAECGECFGSIESAMADAGVEVMFATTLIAGALPRVFYCRNSLLPDLVAAAREMNNRGWLLKIEEGYRTQEMQTRLGRSPEAFDRIVKTCAWEHGGAPPVALVMRRAPMLIANCGSTGTHTMGAAVDISVWRRDDGSEVWRGASYLEMSELTPMTSPFIDEQAQANRRAITETMERHGFMHYEGEFWHYNKGDALYQMIVGSGEPGKYGPVHWDPATNVVTPYADPLAVLTTPEQMAGEVAAAMQRLAAAPP